jgi:hypothetical protein
MNEYQNRPPIIAGKTAEEIPQIQVSINSHERIIR